MMVYLTYEEYKEYGGTLSNAEFTAAEFKCRKRIDRLTDCRVQSMAEVPDSVKMCMMSLIKLESTVGAEAQAVKPIVTSYNTDGYSESYGKAMGTADASKAMDSTVLSMLYGELDDNGVPLLYRGVTGY